MGEQGWRKFLSAEGIDDWVVLHGGATAVFRVGSLGKAARLAEAIARIPGLEGHEQALARLQAAVAAGGRIVDDSHAPEYWTLADRAGNRVCIVSWPDGSVR